MELNEAFQRIIGQHLRLIACTVILGLGVAAFLHGTGTSYTASARLVLDTQDPKSRTEADAIADTGKAIATSPAQVSAALAKAHVRRDPLKVAAQHVGVQPLGTSGVLQLTVSDRSRTAAAAIANALAQQVIQARLQVSNGQLEQNVAAIDQQIGVLNNQISTLDAQIASLIAQGASTKTRATMTDRRDLLAARRTVLEAERVSLLSNQASKPSAQIISPATVPLHPDASHWITSLTLGALLGLVGGIAIAGLLETARPTMVGGTQIAKELDLPLLGALPADPADVSIQHSQLLGGRLSMVAEAVGVHGIRLLSAGQKVNLRPLAASLTRATQVDDHRVTFDVFDLHERSLNGGSAGAGIVVVAPNAIKKSDVIETRQLLLLSPYQVLGLVTYDNAESLRRVRNVQERTAEVISSTTSR